MYLADPRNPGDDPLSLGIEHDHGAVAEMCDEEQVARRIETLVVEARRVASQRHVCYVNERRALARGRASGGEAGQQGGDCDHPEAIQTRGRGAAKTWRQARAELFSVHVESPRSLR